MTPRIFIPTNDPPTQVWRTRHKGWEYLTLYWPTDGTQGSHPHDLTGLAWRDDVVMARWHLGFEVWDMADYKNVAYGIAFDEQSHNPFIMQMSSLWNKCPHTELTLPEPEPRWVAEHLIRAAYDKVIKPDLMHDRQVTPPWSWSDPQLQAYWQNHRSAWWLRCLTYGIDPRTQPWEVFWKAPDMAYELLRKR